jgi:hypothetical protein
MGTAHFYEERSSGMGQESMFYGNRAQLIILSSIISHRGHHQLVIFFGRSKPSYEFCETNIVGPANIATEKNVILQMTEIYNRLLLNQ